MPSLGFATGTLGQFFHAGLPASARTKFFVSCFPSEHCRSRLRPVRQPALSANDALPSTWAGYRSGFPTAGRLKRPRRATAWNVPPGQPAYVPPSAQARTWTAFRFERDYSGFFFAVRGTLFRVSTPSLRTGF